MEIFGEAKVAKFSRRHSASRKSLERFLKIARGSEWRHLMDIRQSLQATDYTSSGRFVFDIGGNKYRLIATINFEKQALLIESIMTHEEYNRKDF